MTVKQDSPHQIVRAQLGQAPAVDPIRLPARQSDGLMRIDQQQIELGVAAAKPASRAGVSAAANLIATKAPVQ